MKLDRNTNRGGHGKYALVNMRKLLPILDRDEDPAQLPLASDAAIADSFRRLVKAGIISLGNETPGDQFFVMKYKDKFTMFGLHAYAQHVADEFEKTGDESLREYAMQMLEEAKTAAKLGNRIPD